MKSVDLQFKESIRMAEWLEHVDLASRTTLDVGGVARWCVQVKSEDDLCATLRDARCAAGVVLLGGGSNVLVLDEGVEMPVMQVACKGIDVISDRGDKVVVRVGAGEVWDQFVAWSVAEGLAGVECLSGIPGWVGASPIQNIGAYGQEVAEVIQHVRIVDLSTGVGRTMDRDSCMFGYRTSHLKKDLSGQVAVVWVEFALQRNTEATAAYPDVLRRLGGDHEGPVTLETMRDLVLEIRRTKSMVYDRADPNHRSAGSFFVNPVLAPEDFANVCKKAAHLGHDSVPSYSSDNGKRKVPAAWLIERSGFSKGLTRGLAGLSTQHCLALINRGNARACDIIALAGEIRHGVHATFGVWLHPEPQILGFKHGWTTLLS